jgi:hypothetical protein
LRTYREWMGNIQELSSCRIDCPLLAYASKLLLSLELGLACDRWWDGARERRESV